jgi:hypothetical protein
LRFLILTIDLEDNFFESFLNIDRASSIPTRMRFTPTLAALAAAIEFAHATVYLVGDSTMAANGANDGSTDGQSSSRDS